MVKERLEEVKTRLQERKLRFSSRTRNMVWIGFKIIKLEWLVKDIKKQKKTVKKYTDTYLYVSTYLYLKIYSVLSQKYYIDLDSKLMDI